ACLVGDRLVGHVGAANLGVAAASESRAHVASGHDHDAVPVEVHVAAGDVEPGARGGNGKVAVLHHEDARPLDGARDVEAGEVRRRVELTAEVHELGIGGCPQVEIGANGRVA